MTTINEKAQVFQLKNTQYAHENIQSYKYDHDLFQEYKIDVISTHKVTWNDLDISSRKGQVRVKDIDQTHLDHMKVSINQVGITHWPIGIYDAESKKITVVSGYHRLNALLELNLPDVMNDAIFPIMLIKCSSKLHLRQWMQKENMHIGVAKTSTKADAIKYIQEMKTEYNLFRGMNAKEVQRKVYDLLGEFFPFIKSTAKKVVYEEAINGKKKETVKSLQKVDQTDLQIRLWNRVHGAGNCIGDKCYIASEYNPSRKSIMIQCVERAQAHIDKPTTEPLEMELIIWSPSSTTDLPQARRSALDSYTKMNLHVIDSKLAVISKVSFPEQDISKCLNNIHSYSWDANKKQFV